MFEDRRKRRELRQALGSLREAENRAKYGSDKQALEQARRDRYRAERNLTQFDESRLLDNARKLGIEVPTPTQKPSWYDDDNDDGNVPSYAVSYWLNRTGRLGVAKLVRDERRKSIEWWIKIATPLLGALISLLGLIVALVTVAKK